MYSLSSEKKRSHILLNLDISINDRPHGKDPFLPGKGFDVRGRQRLHGKDSNGNANIAVRMTKLHGKDLCRAWDLCRVSHISNKWWSRVTYSYPLSISFARQTCKQTSYK
jgi:hypothetical protein